MDTNAKVRGRAAPWNKGKLLGRKPSRPPQPTVADGQRRVMVRQQKTQRPIQLEFTPRPARMSGLG
jgi:hypothetical protein